MTTSLLIAYASYWTNFISFIIWLGVYFFVRVMAQ